jgi:hypothetical protein
MRMEYRTIAPSGWKVAAVAGSTDFTTGAFRGDDAQGPIWINAADLIRWRWLKRRPRGPKAGTVARYAEADRALFSEIRRLMQERKISATKAAQVLAENGKIAGAGTDDSRARRLTKAYIAAKTR